MNHCSHLQMKEKFYRLFDTQKPLIYFPFDLLNMVHLRLVLYLISRV
nr:MAG TPA: hypothetical protein [Bacteriophage sp.]